MATMHSDPEKWSVADVEDFFKHSAPLIEPEYADELRASFEPWSLIVKKNKLNGTRLFKYVNPTFLERQKLPDTAWDIAILECIERLRERREASVSQATHSLATPPNKETCLRSVVGIKRPASPSPVERPGKNKRRIAILQNVVEPAVTTSAKGYMPLQRLSPNDIFYGKTQIGEEVDHTSYSERAQPSMFLEAGKQFKFIAGRPSCADSNFVWKQMKRFMQRQDPLITTRDGESVVYILPYSPALSTQPSATAFRMDARNNYIAVRENVFNTLNGIRLSANEQHSSQDEYSHLLVKYAGTEGEKPLPLLTASDDAFSVSSDNVYEDGSENAEDMAEEGEDDTELGLDEKRIILEEIEQSIESDWRLNKLCKLETTKARSTWNKMKQSKILRDNFIAASKEHIAKLEVRLAGMREQFLVGQVKDKQELWASTGAFEPTIEDILLEKWKIEVYNRRAKPAGPTSMSSKQHRFTPRQADPLLSSHNPDRAIQLDMHDRFTPSPRQDETYSHAPDAVTEPDSHQEFIVPDDLSDFHPLSDRATPEPASATRKLNRKNTGHRPQTPTGRFQRVAHNKETVGERTPIRPGRDALPDRKAHEPATGLADSDDEYFEDPSSFIQPARKSSIIEVSSDSSVIKSVVKRADARKSCIQKPTRNAANTAVVNAYAANPMRLVSEQITQLDYETLAENNDRRKILLKLLHDQTAAFRTALWNCQKQDSLGHFKRRLLKCLKAIEQGRNIDSTLCEEPTMIHSAALLYLAFFFSDHRYYTTLPSASHIRDAALDEQQISLFTNQLRDILTVRESIMFRSKTQSSVAKPTSTPLKTVYHISSDDAEDAGLSSAGEKDMGARKKSKRRRIVEKSATAARSRQAAHERVEEFSQKQRSQTDGGSQVQQIPSDGKGPLIAVNTMRSEGQPAINIDWRIAQNIKEHQIQGVRFMWREITAEGDETVKGCLLAHAMGLGKTMQTITVLMALFKAAQSHDVDICTQLPEHLQLPDDAQSTRSKLRALILCPASLVNNWIRELKQWDTRSRLGRLYRLDLTTNSGVTMQRLQILEQWRDEGGVMLIGYEMFRLLVKRGSELARGTASATAQANVRIHDLALTTADIAVLDEAQHIKAHTTSISIAVTQVTAQSRIALTGTPLSNRVQEIYQIISWVAPGYLGNRAEFAYSFANPIQEGSYKDADPAAKRKARKKLAVLRQEIEPKYLRADITVLKHDLKPKVEYMLTVALSDLQVAAYQRLVAALKEQAERNDVTWVGLFAWFNTLALLTAHPWTFREKLLTEKALKPKDSSRDQTPSDGVEDNDMIAEPVPDMEDAAIPVEGGDVSSSMLAHGFTEERAKMVVGDISDDIDPALSAKTDLFFQILDNTIRIGDKMLVFSLNLATLSYLERLLGIKKMHCCRIDGKTPVNMRTSLIQEFTDGPPGVMLVSTRAGGVGLNIQCANRIVIFDSAFNPTLEQQAIGRAYRIGQPKPVFVYRFIAGGTFEMTLENLQLLKTALADQVVDKKDYKLHAKRSVEAWLHPPGPVDQTDLHEWVGKDPDVLDLVIKEQLARQGPPTTSHIYAIKTTETLQVDAEDAALNEQEQREVAEERVMWQNTRFALRSRRNPPLIAT